MRPGLERMRCLLQLVGNPERGLRCIHIAGTNGKGSTAAFLQSILLQSGYKPGMYTSPHLVDFCERIRFGNDMIGRHVVVELTRQLRHVTSRQHLDECTFFEYATVMALLFFRASGADPVIVETGMGGRYDATNCIQPAVSIITSIGIDHQQYLGDTIGAIASEKAGIIKPGAPLVSAAAHPDAVSIMTEACRRAAVPHLLCGRDFFARESGTGTFDYDGLEYTIAGLRCGLPGTHQIGNAALAIAASSLLTCKGFDLNVEHIRRGIAAARWPGRLECLSRDPVIIFDGAHNQPAWECLAANISRHYAGRKIILVAGIMRDKDIDAFMRCFTPVCHAMVLCRPDIDRAADRELFSKFIRFSSKNRIVWEPEPHAALRRARQMITPGALICVTGSLYLVGALYSEFCPAPYDDVSGLIAL